MQLDSFGRLEETRIEYPLIIESPYQTLIEKEIM